MYLDDAKMLKLFVLLPIVFIVLLMGANMIFGGMISDAIKTHAEEQAKAYSRELFPNEHSVVVCQGVDTDSNGYVSCSLRVGERPVQPIECAAYVWVTYNNGCRQARLFAAPPSN